MKTSVKQVIAVIAIVAIIAASLPIAAFGMAETNANVQPDEIWDGSIAEGFAGGTGTEADPYLISNGAELAYLAQQTNSGISYQGSYFALTNDIYLNDTTDWESWGNDTAPANEWTAIGTESSPFSGSFDGNGHVVSGVYINELESQYQGLFGYTTSRSTIANLGVSESYIYGGDCVGGVVGENGGEVTNCYNTGSITGSECVGGVVGCNDADNEVTACYNTGSVNGSELVGGVVGVNYGTIFRCYNTGSITGDSNIGGVVGKNFNFNGDCINVTSNCYNTGSVTGGSNVGGVVGFVINLDFYGDKDGEGYSLVSRCYNTGSVTGGSNVGGVVGENDDVTFTNCYYLDTCCESGDEYAVALTDEQMQAEASFVGFDFETVWTMEANQAYPYPELISNPHIGSAVPGDLDGDGEITTIDANMVLRIALYLEDYNSNGDVDNDGTVTLADANTILRWALGF